MALANNSVSQKEYLKKYLSDDGKKKKKKKVKTMSTVKRSQIIDDDIDLKTMRPLDDDEVDLYQMDEDTPQIAGIVDDRPPEVKAQEYYNAKRWKVFGGDDGVNVVDSMDRNQQNMSDVSHSKSIHSEKKNAVFNDKYKSNSLNRPTKKKTGSEKGSCDSCDSDVSPVRNNKDYNDTVRRDKHNPSKLKRQKESKSVHDDYDSDLSLTRNNKRKCSDSSPPRKHNKYNSDSDVSLPRKKSSNNKRKKHSSDSDVSPPRKYHLDKPRYKGDTDKSPARREKKHPQNKQRQRSVSDESPPRTDKGDWSRYKSENSQRYKDDTDESPSRREKKSSRNKQRQRSDSDESPQRTDKGSRYKSENSQRYKDDTDESPTRREKKSSRNKQRQRSDSDESPPRTGKGDQSRYKSRDRPRYKDETEKSPPKREKARSQNKSRQRSYSNESLSRTGKEDRSRYKSGDRPRYKGEADKLILRREKEKSQNKLRQRSDSDESPPRTGKGDRSIYTSDSDNSPLGREKKGSSNKSKHKKNSDESPHRISNKQRNPKYESDSDHSLPRKQQQIIRDGSQYKIEKKDTFSQNKRFSDSDQSPPRLKERERKTQTIDDMNSRYSSRRTKERSSSRSNSPPRKEKKNSRSYRYDNVHSVKGSQRSSTPPLINKSLQAIKSNKTISPRLSRRDLMDEKNARRRFSDSDDSPPRRKSNSFCRNDSASDFSPPHKTSSRTKTKMSKKALYIPHDSSSSEETSKNKKMITTLDGKQAGLQDAKQLRKELSDLRMKEDLMFSNLDASVSGVGAAAIKRDRKTGQVRDIEKEKQAQKEKDAKAAVVKEKYYKWGKGVKQMEDAEVRAAEIMKEMNKPLARYANDEDLDNFLKAQDREGDPMLDFIKQNQKEATALVGEKPIYKGSYNPNRFGIRPGHRWDGVVRSSGYEKEWFAHQNARKARDEDAYKWSTSDM